MDVSEISGKFGQKAEKFALVSCQVSELLDSKLLFHSGNFENSLTLPHAKKWINTRTWDSRRASLWRT